MQVFRIYFTIIRKNLPQMGIYFGVFIVMAVLFIKTGSPGAQTGFSGTVTKMALISDDGPSALSAGLERYLSRYARLVPLKDDKSAIADALFYHDVSYVLRIPAGFAAGLMAGKAPELRKTMIPGSSLSVYLDLGVNRYVDTALLLAAHSKASSQEVLARETVEALSKEVPATISAGKRGAGPSQSIDDFFNYVAFILISVLISGVGTFLMVFNQADVRKRNLCSPLPFRKMNAQVIAGNMVFMLACLASMVGIGFAMFGRAMLSWQVLAMGLNSLVFAIVCLGISLLIGSLVRDRNALSAITNILAIGMSLLCGVLVPQLLLGKAVMSIARFLPAYWFVRANNELGNLGSPSLSALKPILGYAGMELGMGVAVFAVALLVIKQKRQSQEA
jgi:ABC-2 type transport system permease protein